VTACPTTICGASPRPFLLWPRFARGGIDLLARQRAAVNLAVLVAFVFLVDLEVQRGGVVEDDFHVEIEQVSHAVVDGLFAGFLVRFQEVHGAV